MTNIALVVLDTVRKDAFDRYFTWLEGERFENAYSTANWTGPAHASLFTGEYGSSIGVSSKSRSLDCDCDVLAEQLQEVGYTTRGWSTNPNVSTTVNFDRGFAEFLEPYDIETGDADIINISEKVEEYDHLSTYRQYLHITRDIFLSDCDTLASLTYGLQKVTGKGGTDIPDDGASVVLDRIQETEFEEPEFLFINLMEAHTPYFPPEAYRDFDEPVRMQFGDAYFGVENPELVRDGYDAAVRYLGDIYRDIFDALSDSFDYILTLSDHGELLGEHHNMWNHVSGIYPELTHVPLVISGPGYRGYTEEPVSLLDVYATIAELAGIETTRRGVPVSEAKDNTDPYLAEYRGPFQESLDKADRRDIDLAQFDTDLFALIESESYRYEDYDGWREQTESPYERPRETLHELVERYSMKTLEQNEVELDKGRARQLADLGYM
jgi:arylsulfatase A-like enzyme